VKILCEGVSKSDDTRLMGRTGTNKIVVFEGNPERHIGQIFQVKITDFAKFTLYGDAVLAN
jgi:tRNA-2-methylthio-N6-dimethylallyladenosine synthase